MMPQRGRAAVQCGSLIIAVLTIICGVTCEGGQYDDDNSGVVVDPRSSAGDFHGSFMVGRPTGVVAIHPAPSVLMTTSNANVSDQQRMDDRVTDILHGLFLKYDNRVRPLYGQPLVITLSLSAFHVLDVLEGESEMTSSVVVQQKWMDPRLVFLEGGDGGRPIQYITMNQEHVRDLWLPDTHFVNEKLVDTSVAADTVVLYSHGAVLRSMRLTVTTQCTFDYRAFPFDQQKCQLLIGSHAYGSNDLEYIWDEDFIALKIRDAHYLLQRVENDTPVQADNSNEYGSVSGRFVVTNVQLNQSSRAAPKSTLALVVSLQRAWRPFITRFYLPMALFVMVSLGSLFLSDHRVALLINLANVGLVNVFVGLVESSDALFPRCYSSTALDSYVVMSLSFVLLCTTISGLHLMQRAPSTPILPRRRTNTATTTTTTTDLFSQDDVSSSSGGHQRIYRSPSYPLRLSSRRSYYWGKAVSATVCCWGWCHNGIVAKGWYRWGIVLVFLICDYSYFATHRVQYINGGYPTQLGG